MTPAFSKKCLLTHNAWKNPILLRSFYLGVIMDYVINVPRGSTYWSYPLLSGSDFQKIVVEGVVVFDIIKHHNHRYYLDAFFYSSKRIVSGFSFRSKRDLYGAIQKLLQEELNVDVQ